MRNAELHGLRGAALEVERLQDDLEAARERVRSWQAKTEDLQAQMDTRAQQER